MATEPVSRADIEAKLREIRGEAESTTRSLAPYVLAGGVVAVLAVVSVAYFFGRRSGKKQRTVVEIRRV